MGEIRNTAEGETGGEAAPPLGPGGDPAPVGAALMFEILCPLAEATAKRRAQ